MAQMLKHQPPELKYLLAVLSVFLATLATWYIPVLHERAVFLCFVFSMLQAALWLGIGPGLLATALSLVAVNFLFLLGGWRSAPYDILILNLGFCILAGLIMASTLLYRRATAALADREEDLKRAQAIAQTGSWRLNVRTNALHCSDEGHRIFGTPTGSPFSFDHFLSIVHPDDRLDVARCWQAAKEGKPCDFIHRIVVAGQIKWVRERAELEIAANGAPSAGFGTVQDITQAKLIEEALQASQQRLANIVDTALDAVISIDSSHQIVQFNSAAEKLFGYPAAEALGLPINCLIPQRYRQHHTASIDAFAASDIACRRMGRLNATVGLRADGKEFPVENAISQTEYNGEKLFTVILRDLTQQVQAEQTLRQQITLQEQLAQIAATVPGVIYAFRQSPDGVACMPYASAALEEVCGIRPEAVVADIAPAFSRIPPGDLEHINATIAESARSMTPWREIFRYQHPRKGQIWIEGHAMPRQESDGGILWQGYLQDVTDRKGKEQALFLLSQTLKRRLDEMQSIFETAPIGLAIADDANGLHIRGNRALEELLGLPPGAELSMRSQREPRFYFFQAERQLSVDELPMQRAVRGEPVSSEIIDVERPNAETVTLFSNATPLYDERGQTRGAVGAFLDITALKRAESECRLSEQRWKQLAETMPNMVWTCSPEGLCDYLSQQWMEYTGIDMPAQLGFGWVEQVHALDRAALIAAWNQAVTTGRPFHTEFRIRRHDGAYRWFKTRAQPIWDDSGHIIKWYGSNTDIQDLREMQDILQAGEQFKQAVLDALPASIATLDRHGIIRSVNQPWLRFARENGNPDANRVGVGVDYLQVCGSASRNGDPYADQALKGLEAVLGGERHYFELEYPCHAPTAERWFTMQVVQPAREIGGAVVIHIDVSDRKWAENALRASEELYRGMFELAAVGLAQADPETGCLQRVNEKFCSITGYSSNELIGRPFTEITHPDDRQRDWETFRRAIRGETRDYRNEKRYLRKDGDAVWVSVNAAILRDGKGQPERTVAVIEDISERKKAEMALRESETRLKLALDAANAGLWDRNLISDESYFSPEWKQQLGYADTELANHWETWEDLLHPDDREQVLSMTQDFLAHRCSTYDLEYRLRHKDGTYRWMQSRGALLADQQGNAYRMLGLNLDITAHKKEQDLRNRRGKMEELFRLYVATQTAATIAHELNQPLTAIASYSEAALLLLNAQNPNPEKLKQVLESNVRQAERAGQVMRQLLILLQKGEPLTEPVDLNSMVLEALDLTKAETEMGACDFALHLAADLPWVYANRMQIEKVLVNLLRNALQSMREAKLAGGQIDIISRNTLGKEPMAQVTVRDCGKGLHATDLNTLFQPFFTTKPTGLGMGLAVSRALIEAHGGKLWAERNPDSGLSFHFTLPFAP